MLLSYKRKDYIMEVGLHEMDWLYETDLKKEIFEELACLIMLSLCVAKFH